MKTYFWLTSLLICSLGAGAAEAVKPAHAAKPAHGAAKPAAHKPTAAHPSKAAAAAPSSTPLAAGPAEVNQERVNVRARADVDSDVVARLKNKDSVVVIEEVSAKSAGPGEPARWAKIAWPEGAAVWVYADFLDRQGSTVKVAKLNLRSGPSENHNVVGTLEKGASVKKLEAKGDWWKIEAPSSCAAYVSAHFLTSKAPKEAVAAMTPPSAPSVTGLGNAPASSPVPAPARPRPIARPMAPPPPVVATPVEENLAVVPAQRPAVSAPVPRPAPPQPVFVPPPAPVAVTAPAPVPKVTDTVLTSKPVTPPSAPAVLPREPGQVDIRPIPETAFVKRVVTREGRVRRAWSIQSPTPLILENLHNGRVMNYLYSTSTNINLSSFRGQVVTVSGEEALDERWPNIPVIRVETLQTAP